MRCFPAYEDVAGVYQSVEGRRMMTRGLVLFALVVAVAAAGSMPGAATPPLRCAKTDVPDLKFKDTNCDGIDGVAARAVFVAPFGADSNPGTRQRPLRTLQAAVGRAAAQHKDVYAAIGAYDVGTGLELASGVSIYGGYNRAWKRSATYGVLITGAPQAVVGSGVHGVMVQLVTLHGSAADGDELSVYAARLVGSSVTFDHDHIVAGGARPGPAGASAGTAGGPGGNGQPATGPNAPGAGGTGGGFDGGAGGPQCCGVSGGAQDGKPGQGPGGGGGGKASPPSSNSGPPVMNGGPGGGGQPGTAGTAGTGGAAAADSAAETWAGKNGAAGGNGQPGAGGGGGGGASSYTYSSSGGSGGASGSSAGGGGAGGAPGTGGSGGGYGGGSFAIYLWQSQVAIRNSTVATGNGGAGGAGRDGGAGGAGGTGGKGLWYQVNTGGDGGTGGAGGAGGAGGGGAGGPSIGVFRGGGSTAVATGSTFTLGAGGPGGASSGQPGETGTATATA